MNDDLWYAHRRAEQMEVSRYEPALKTPRGLALSCPCAILRSFAAGQLSDI